MMTINEKTRLREILSDQLKDTLASNSSIISDWFIVAVNGSYNYDLNTEKSDVDSKLLVISSLDDLIHGRTHNYVHHYWGNGKDEHVEVKDINSYFKTMLKQNINFVETLYATEVIVNSKYQKYWDILIEFRDVISSCNPFAAIDCIVGMMTQKMKKMFEDAPSRHDSIEKYGYDLKSFHHFMRLYFFLADYCADKPYMECLRGRDKGTKEQLKYYKTFPSHMANEDCVQGVMEVAVDIRNYFYEDYLKYRKDFAAIEQDVKDILDLMVKDIIIDSLELK